VALRQGSLLGLPAALKGHLSPEHEPLQRSLASAFFVAAACDGLSPAAELTVAACSAGVLAAVAPPPPRTYNHTRRLTVPTYCLAGTRTKRRRGRRGFGGDDDELGDGGGDGGGFGGGDDWWNQGGGDEGEDADGSLAARLQDLLLLWTVFCALAFCQTVYHVSPKPKTLPPPAFAALSYSGIKARLLSHPA
jgi:hypothetical protein